MERLLGMLAETDVHPGEYEMILEKLRDGAESRVLEAYPEVPGVLAELRARGLRLAICSNWDWDLAQAVDEVGLADLVDVRCRRRGPAPEAAPADLRGHADEARRRARRVRLRRRHVGTRRRRAARMGMTPVYLCRDGHWPIRQRTDDLDPRASWPRDLRGVLDLV